jgi:hypothetical protein
MKEKKYINPPGMLLSLQTYHIHLSSITVVDRPRKYLNVGVRELAKTKTLTVISDSE